LAEIDSRGDSWSAGFLVQLLLQGASADQVEAFWQRWITPACSATSWISNSRLPIA
jgi:cell division inhibitor SulA